MYYSSGRVLRRDVQHLRMPDSTVVSLGRQKRMGVTSVSGGYGTVKEIFGFDDWRISVDGITDNEDILRGFEQLDSLSDSIRVGGSELFEYFNIFRVVIESISLKQMRGRGRLTEFQMNLISDEPVQLIWKSE